MNEELETTPITFLDPRFNRYQFHEDMEIGLICWKVEALLGDVARMAQEDEGDPTRHGHTCRATSLLGLFLENPWHCWAVLTCPRVGSVQRVPRRRPPFLETVLGSLRHRAWTGIQASLAQEDGVGLWAPSIQRRDSTDLWPSVKESTENLRELLRRLTPTITKARALPHEWEHPVWRELSATVREHVQSLPNTLGVLAALPIELVDHTYGSPLLGRPSGIGAGPTPLTDFLRCSLRGTMRDAAIVALEDLLMDEEQFTRFLDGEDLWRP